MLLGMRDADPSSLATKLLAFSQLTVILSIGLQIFQMVKPKGLNIMKKLMFILAVAFLAVQLQAKLMVQLGAGIDLAGKQTFSNETFGSDSDVNTGVSLFGELLSAGEFLTGEMLFGLGMEYQVPRELKNLSPDAHKRQYSYLPVYATLKYVLLPVGITPEAQVQFGYNFLVSEKNFELDASNNFTANGGFYWAMGAGVDFKPFLVQLLYKSMQSSFEWNDVSASVQGMESNNVQSQLSLQVGVRL